MALLFSLYEALPGWLVSILGFLVFCLQVYLIVDAIRNSRDFYWFWILFGLPFVGSLIYLFCFKWDGSRLEFWLFKSGRNARHLEQLESAVRRIGNAANHEELGDELWRQRKFARAEESYRTALAKDPGLLDSRARLGYCLLALNRPSEAWPELERVLLKNRGHDHEHLLCEAARCMRKLGDLANARKFYEEYEARHSYAEPRVELAEVCAELGDTDDARRICEEVIADVKDSPGYTRRNESPFAGRAKRLLRALKQ